LTGDPAAQFAPPNLGNAQLPLEGRIDLGARVCPQDMFIDVVNPEGRDSHGPSEMIETFGISQLGRFQIKPAGLIIAETVLDGHALQVIFPCAGVSR
jgi:hypothetical protein